MAASAASPVASYTTRWDTTRRENLARVDWRAVGSRFATDSQSLTLNWPTRRKRTPVVVQHLATAHARSGFVMEASLQFDPAVSMDDIEAQMAASGDFQRKRCFRRQGRGWSKTEFEEHLAKQRAQRPVEEVEDIDLYRLPHTGALVRLDILQFAHAARLREMLKDHDGSLMFVLDGDQGLRAAFLATFAEAIRAERVEVAVVYFDKGLSNDKRNQAVADGRKLLAEAANLTLAQLRELDNEAYADLQDTQVAHQVATGDPREGFPWPCHTKSEPGREVSLLTHRAGRDPKKTARLIRLATLRSVDAYFHKMRSNLRFAERPSSTPSGGDRAWDRYYLYKPETMAKLVEIYRFSHNWMGDGKGETPAMRPV